MPWAHCKNGRYKWTVKKLLEGKPGGRRKEGRPRLQWMDDVESDLRNMGVKRWRTRALDRSESSTIKKEAKGKLKRPNC
jgi:hypothetical protein